MTTYYVTEDIVTAGAAYNFGILGDGLFVTSIGSVINTGAGYAVSANAGSHRVTVAGWVQGERGVRLGDPDAASETTGANRLVIAAGGSIAAETTAVGLSGFGNILTNAGSISGRYGVLGGWDGMNPSSNSTITNSGRIDATAAGIVVLADQDRSGGSISNSGVIATASTGISAIAYGALELTGGIVAAIGAGMLVSNSGTISVADLAGYGIALMGTGGEVRNSGLIETNSTAVSRAAVDFLTLAATDTALLTNTSTGRIHSARTAVDGGAGRETVVNDGEIVGNVNLGAGDDSYDGRLGTLRGVVHGGAGVDTIFTGAGDNTIHGDDGNDVLGGGAGADSLFGGAGRDTLRGGAGADLLNGGDDIDIASYLEASAAVVASLTNPSINTGDATGDSYSSIENLYGSVFNDRLYGSSVANTISGGSGRDVINGYAGNDTLTGGNGADTYVFATALNASTNVDRITDFKPVDDTMQLENAIFAALTATGTLAASAFRANATGLAGDATDRIIYETDTGNVFYDVDGTGAGAAVLFAKLTTGLALTSQDFVVI